MGTNFQINGVPYGDIVADLAAEARARAVAELDENDPDYDLKPAGMLTPRQRKLAYQRYTERADKARQGAADIHNAEVSARLDREAVEAQERRDAITPTEAADAFMRRRL